MATEHEAVTLGEVYRGIRRVEARLDTFSKEVIGRGEYESDQEGIAARFAAIERAAHDLQKAQRDAEAWNKENRSKWALALTLAIVSPILTVLVNLLPRMLSP